AFDQVRKGQTKANAALIEVALDAKDHIHRLIETPDAEIEGGEAILAHLRAIVAGTAPAPIEIEAPQPAVASAPAPAAAKPLWRLEYVLPADALIYGTNPLLLLDELAEIGPTAVTALTGRIPDIGALDPEVPHIGWRVDIEADDPTAAI